MKYLLQIMLVYFIVFPMATAEWSEGENSSPIPDTHWRASSGDFAAMLLITNDPDRFFEQWNRPPSSDYRPDISTTKIANRGDTLVVITLFTGCESDEIGNCDSEIDFRILSPDGGVYSEHNNAELWIEKPRPPKGSLRLSRSNIRFRIEADDPLGRYVIEVILRDNISSKVLKLCQYVFVEEKGDGDG